VPSATGEGAQTSSVLDAVLDAVDARDAVAMIAHQEATRGLVMPASYQHFLRARGDMALRAGPSEWFTQSTADHS
jgi:hypothetical protein